MDNFISFTKFQTAPEHLDKSYNSLINAHMNTGCWVLSIVKKLCQKGVLLHILNI